MISAVKITMIDDITTTFAILMAQKMMGYGGELFRSFLNREENFFYFLGRFVIAGKEARENIQIVIH